MAYRPTTIKPFSNQELLDALHKNAMLYSEYADTTLLFLFKENKFSEYDYYEVRFGKNNFMHLAGIKSKTLTAIQFFDACVNKEIEIKDCSPRKDKITMYSKISIMKDVLDFKNSKCYKIGEKNLITKDNDFEMATGNSYGVIGYDSRITHPKSKLLNKNKAAIPTTLLNNALTNYCSKPQRIIFILQKIESEEKYQTIFYEIKRGLLDKEYEFLPSKIKNKISYYQKLMP